MSTGKIGDVICATPFFRELKKYRPESKITVLMYGLTKPILISNPNIDEIVEIEKYSDDTKGILELLRFMKSKNFEWSFNLTTGPLTNVIPYLVGIKNRAVVAVNYLTIATTISAYSNNYRIWYKKKTLLLDYYLMLLSFMDIKTDNRKKELYLDELLRNKVEKILEKENIDAKNFNVVISVTAGVELKEWGINNFARLSDALIDKYNARIIFTGSSKDKEKINQVMGKMKYPVIDLSGLFNLKELMFLMEKADLFIGVDTGPLYMANALDVPVVDIIGPVDVYSQPPIYEKCEVVLKNIYCWPCSFTPGPAHECKEGHLRCLKETTVDDVVAAVERLVKKYNIL